MSAGFVDTFDTKIPADGELRASWNQLKDVIDGGVVPSRKEAYLTFSRALNISNTLPEDETLKKLWKDILESGCFSIKDTDLKFDFSTLLDLFNEGREGFEVTWIQVNSTSDEIDEVAECINSIALESLGPAPGAADFKSKLELPITFCMVAKSGDTPIACTYGTYVEELQLFHMNFLGRKINYPGVHILERLQGQISILRERYPGLQCVTLCVQETNVHMQPIYRSLGFKSLNYVEKGFQNKPMYFYGKELVDDAILPDYETFKPSYEAARKEYIWTE